MNNKLINLDQHTFQTEFTNFFKSLQDRVLTKSSEYSYASNAFANFNSAATLKDVDPRIVLDWYMTKHLISYQDMIEKIDIGYKIPDSLSAEKLGDLIVYLGILHVMNCTKNKETDELPF